MVKFKHAYSSTSTVFAEQTIASPDYDQILFWYFAILLRSSAVEFYFFNENNSIAVIIQTQVCDSTDSDLKLDLKTSIHKEFDLLIELPPHLGGIVNPADVPESLLHAETIDDLELQMKITAGLVPTVDTVFRFQ